MRAVVRKMCSKDVAWRMHSMKRDWLGRCWKLAFFCCRTCWPRVFHHVSNVTPPPRPRPLTAARDTTVSVGGGFDWWKWFFSYLKENAVLVSLTLFYFFFCDSDEHDRHFEHDQQAHSSSSALDTCSMNEGGGGGGGSSHGDATLENNHSPKCTEGQTGMLSSSSSNTSGGGGGGQSSVKIFINDVTVSCSQENLYSAGGGDGQLGGTSVIRSHDADGGSDGGAAGCYDNGSSGVSGNDGSETNSDAMYLGSDGSPWRRRSWLGLDQDDGGSGGGSQKSKIKRNLARTQRR